MATKKERIAVVRVSRQPSNHINHINQINPVDNQDDTNKVVLNSHIKPNYIPRVERIPLNKNEHNDVSRTKTDVFTLTPRLSNAKSDDLNQQSSRAELSSQPTVIIQHQPTPPSSWLKRSSINEKRPELNWKLTGKWSHDLFSLSEDWNMCYYACACWCCFRHEISSMMGEHWCLWFVNCTALMDLRVKFRQQYGIQGSIAEDCCLSTCCPLCVALQLANEGRDYGHRIFS